MMKLHEKFLSASLPTGFYWFNEPTSYRLGNGLEISTEENTDFWQNTHYGFQHDDGHCCFVKLSGDFSVTTHVTFQPEAQYDQSGLMIRANSMNWIKASTEYENEQISRLGSVVTNLGYSDWATQDISSSQREMWYRIRRRENDFLIENSIDGQKWLQMRIAHLHQVQAELEVGVYTCSPTAGGFWSRFDLIDISDNHWFHESE